MKTETENLMKHFASVLRGRAMGTLVIPSISTSTLKYLSRKELIEMVKKRFDGTIPKEHNLVELENEELLNLIEDEMLVIAFITDKWSKEPMKSNGTKVSTKVKPVPVKKSTTKPSESGSKNNTVQ